MGAPRLKNVVVLGSTGSVGQNTLAVIRKDPSRFRVFGLACGSNTRVLAAQIEEFCPAFVYTDREDPALRERFPGVGFLQGDDGLARIAALDDADLIVAAIPGIRTLLAVAGGIRKAKTIALATKELLVSGGDLLMRLVRRCGATLLPVDSEHNAIFQLLQGGNRQPGTLERIYLTASGGPFRGRKDTADVTPEEVLAHPVWRMGRKITVDSATLMNKAFEMIEAHHLFALPEEKIEVLIHPEAIVHGLVEFSDGSVQGLLSPPDMKFAIGYALNFPRRAANHWGRLDLGKTGRLTFETPDRKAQWLRMARRAIREKGSVPIVLNAANDEAANLFLAGNLRFPEILETVREVLRVSPYREVKTLESIGEIDREARERTRIVAEEITC